MKRWICLILTLAIFLTLAAGCGKTEVPPQPELPPEPAAPAQPELPAEPELPTQPEPPAEAEPPAEEKKYNILFVGNSSTFYNDMPDKIFEKMAADRGYEVKTLSLTKASHRLDQFADPNDDMGAMLEKLLQGKKKYDYVVLQDLCRRPTANPAQFYKPVNVLVEKIRAAGAQPILYATIARQTGHEALKQDGLTNETMTWKSAAAYETIGQALDVPVAHCGVAFYDVNTNAPEIRIYDLDLAHPTYEGSYLIGACIFAKIFGEDPTALTYRGRVSEEEMPIPLEAARKAVFEPLPVPETYMTDALTTLHRVLPELAGK